MSQLLLPANSSPRFSTRCAKLRPVRCFRKRGNYLPDTNLKWERKTKHFSWPLTSTIAMLLVRRVFAVIFGRVYLQGSQGQDTFHRQPDDGTRAREMCLPRTDLDLRLTTTGRGFPIETWSGASQADQTKPDRTAPRRGETFRAQLYYNSHTDTPEEEGSKPPQA